MRFDTTSAVVFFFFPADANNRLPHFSYPFSGSYQYYH
jgi:hypothetical protein